MRIVLVEPRGSGGMVHYAYQMCNALSGHVSEVTLITSTTYELDGYPRQFQLKKLLKLWGLQDKLAEEPSKNAFDRIWRKVYRSTRRVFRGARLVLEWIKLSLYLLKKRPDIIQFGEIEFPFEAFFLQFLKSRGLILTQICHEFEPRERSDSFSVRVNNLLLKNVFRAFSAIFFHSHSNMKRFRELYPEIPPERFHVIAMGNGQIFPSNGDLAPIRRALLERYGISGTEKIVLFFGHITPSKGVPDLLCAFEKVHMHNKDARLVVAGMPLKYIDVNSLFAMTSKLGIQSVTRFDTRYLPMTEVGPLMDLASVVVFPYLSSTQSGAIQAAYAFGKPVVATRVGGLPDVVEEGESGFLVDPGSPDQLSDAILKIISDNELAEKMGLFAKHLSDTRFAWGPIAESIVEVYKTFLPENRHL